MRSPTQDAKILNSWTGKTWPHWPVAKGDLTDRGAALVEAMWKNMRGRFSEYGLLPSEVCPKPDLIYVRADVDERTKATARAILNGLAANCRLGFAVLPNAAVDPLFHPVKAGLYNFNPIECATDVLAMTHGGLSALQERLSARMALLANILGPPDNALCTRFAMIRNCSLGDLPNAISISPNGEDIRLIGSLSIGSSAAEIFLLEYAQWPDNLAGWGLVNEKILQDILPIHSTVFDVVNRAPVVAWAKGSALLSEIASALEENHADQRVNEARVVIFVGHDTNIANIGSLLKAGWQGRDYPQNGIPPASALAFELWEVDGRQEVVAKFYAQTLKTLHTSLQVKEKNNMDLFAPAENRVYDMENGVEMRIALNELLKQVQEATAGAPIPPQATPPLDFAKIIPAP